MKKKSILILLLLSMVMSACGSNQQEASEQEAAIKQEMAVTEDSIEEAEPLKSYEKGTVTTEGWESEWLEMGYVAPAGVTMLTENELKEIMALGQEVLYQDIERFQLDYTKLPTVYEMIGRDEDGITTLMVTVEKLDIAMEGEEYLSSFAEGLSETASMTYQVLSDSEVLPLGGKEFNVLKCLVSYNGLEMNQDYYLAVVEDRAVHLLVTYTEAEKAEEILSGFVAYER